MSCQSRFNARYWMLGAGALGRPRGMVWEGRREEGSGWGTHVHLWQIHFDIWQNQYNIVKLKNKTKLKKKRLFSSSSHSGYNNDEKLKTKYQFLARLWRDWDPHTLLGEYKMVQCCEKDWQLLK